MSRNSRSSSPADFSWKIFFARLLAGAIAGLVYALITKINPDAREVAHYLIFGAALSGTMDIHSFSMFREFFDGHAEDPE